MKIALVLLFIGLSMSPKLFADTKNFNKGPVLQDYGENVEIENGLDNATSQVFKVVFDVSKENTTDAPHSGFNSIARFINMHARAGVPQENIETALVVHGKASFDLLNQSAYQERFNKANPSAELLNDLLNSGVKIYVCGQSSNYHGIARAELNDGVELSLSAMTANALLQQQGYTLNPF